MSLSAPIFPMIELSHLFGIDRSKLLELTVTVGPLC